MDGTSLGVWAEVFSEECRKAQGLTVENPINEAELYSSRPLMHQDRKDRQVTIEDAKGVDHWPVAESLPPVVTATDWQAAVFYMSRENQKKIKADATPANATIPNNVPWISTNDAIDALIWRTLTMAQGKPVNPEEQSIFTIAVDGRRKVDMDIHPRLLGSMLQVVAADATLGKIYDGSYTLADLAILHRRAVMYTMSRKSIEDVTALQQKLWAENPEIMLVPQGVDKMPRAFQFVTSWAGWDLPAFDFGPKIGRVQAVRVPSNGYFNGINVIFPKLPDGGLEIMIAQPKEQMERVKADPFFGKYAVLR
ncbi:hypothetical protein KEM55_007716 [Ascosphaera atra]|nr:hypothetical protein KEM55_007716 [Ascosphaera atra]